MSIVVERANRNIRPLNRCDSKADVSSEPGDIANELPAVKGMSSVSGELNTCGGKCSACRQSLNRDVISRENSVPKLPLAPNADKPACSGKEKGKNGGKTELGENRESGHQQWKNDKPISLRYAWREKAAVCTAKCDHIVGCQLVVHGHSVLVTPNENKMSYCGAAAQPVPVGLRAGSTGCDDAEQLAPSHG
jgi:hypothetical protein